MENLESAQGGWSYHVVSYGEAPTRKLRTMPIAFSGSGHTRKTNKLSDAVIHLKEESTHRVPKSASQAVLSRMQLALHATRRTPHGASRLVLAMPAWSVKTRRAPPRHCKDARLYCHTATAIHDMSTHHPPRARSGGLIMRKAVIIDMNIVVCFVLLAVCCLLPSFYCSKATGLLSTVFYVRCSGACSCLYLVM